jgi:hypothetical protein
MNRENGFMPEQILSQGALLWEMILLDKNLLFEYHQLGNGRLYAVSMVQSIVWMARSSRDKRFSFMP